MALGIPAPKKPVQASARRAKPQTAEDILRFAREYLTDSNLTVGLLLPPDSDPAAADAQAPDALPHEAGAE